MEAIFQNANKLPSMATWTLNRGCLILTHAGYDVFEYIDGVSNNKLNASGLGTAASSLLSAGTGNVWIVSKHTGVARLFQLDPDSNNGDTYVYIRPMEAEAIINHINHLLVLNQGF